MTEPPIEPTALVVSSDPHDQCLLESQLRRAGGGRILTAETGAQALEMIARKMPDLILLDAAIPDMDGYEVACCIRSAYPDEFAPIILISASPSPQERAAGLRAGASDVISRPFDLDELVARIASQFSLKRTYDRLRLGRERMALLYDIRREIVAELDYESLLYRLVSVTTSLTRADKALLVVLENGVFREQIIARAGEPVHAVPSIPRQVLEDGLVGWVIKNRQAALISDLEKDPRWVQLPNHATTARSAAAIPLMRSEVTGVLLMTSARVNAFQEEHLDMLVAIGGQAAIALENARLFRAVRKQRARAEALLQQTGDPVIITDCNGVITSVNPAAAAMLGLGEDTHGSPLDTIFSLHLSDLVTRACERGSPVSGEYTLRRPGAGQARTFNVSVSPVEDVGFMLVWQDITALKEAERVRLQSERAETRRVLEAFSRYMSPALVERVLGDPDILTRRERREAIVLFADLRGFTRLTMEHAPDDVITLLNDAFAEMMEIVYQHEGVIFDIAGDELLVGFNVPYSQPDARRRALATAIAMQRRFRSVRARWAARGMEVGIGIGINVGQVVLGHVGGRSRMSYSMVGQAVNIAHRLVELACDGQIVASPDVLAQGLPDGAPVTVRELPPRQLRGADRPQEMVLLELEPEP
ncbi:MAG: response regulator [Chloroflexi bacterium]|nr:response regulator [Chloroflexota bacterium]